MMAPASCCPMPLPSNLPTRRRACAAPAQATLRDTFELLLLRLLDSGRLLAYEDGDVLVKTINVLTLRVLEQGCAWWVGGWVGG